MTTILKYELKKIICRKETYLTSIIMSIILFSLCYVSVKVTTYDTLELEASGSEAIQLIHQNQNFLNGVLDQETIQNLVADVRLIYDNPHNFSAEGTLKDEVYIEQIQPKSEIISFLCKAFSEKGQYNPNALLSISDEEVHNFYMYYQDRTQYNDESNALTAEHPLYYGDHLGWRKLFDNLWIFNISITMMVTVILAGIFSSEKELGMSALLRCTLKGNLQLGRVKIISAFIISSCFYLVSLMVYVFVFMTQFSTTGYNVSVQFFSFTSPLSLNMFESFILCSILSYLSYLFMAMLVVFLSNRTQRTLLTCIISIIVIIIPMFIPISDDRNFINFILRSLPCQLMNPAEMLKNDLFTCRIMLLCMGLFIVLCASSCIKMVKSREKKNE